MKRHVVAAVAMAAGLACGEDLVINSFEQNGRLMWTFPTNDAISYRVEWSPSLAPAEFTNFASANALDAIAPTGDTMSVSVPVFYRVVAATIPPPEPRLLHASGVRPSMAIINGKPAVCFSSSSTLHFVQANDENGDIWPEPVRVNTSWDVFHGGSLASVNGNPAIAYGSWYPSGAIAGLEYVRALDPGGSSWTAPVMIDANGGAGHLAVVNGKPRSPMGAGGIPSPA